MLGGCSERTICSVPQFHLYPRQHTIPLNGGRKVLVETANIVRHDRYKPLEVVHTQSGIRHNLEDAEIASSIAATVAPPTLRYINPFVDDNRKVTPQVALG